MAEDVMSELRRALSSGDGAAMVAAVSAGGFDRCLQLVGEVLIASLDRAAAGADELAGRCVAALRARDWDGDQQLIDTLEQARVGARSIELIELAVDLEQLGDLLDAGPDSGPGRLDLATGEAWPEAAFEDEWTDESDDDHDEADDGGRWLAVWPVGSRAAYRDMTDFAATRTDAIWSTDWRSRSMGRARSRGSSTCRPTGRPIVRTGSRSPTTGGAAWPAPGSPTPATAVGPADQPHIRRTPVEIAVATFATAAAAGLLHRDHSRAPPAIPHTDGGSH